MLKGSRQIGMFLVEPRKETPSRLFGRTPINTEPSSTPVARSPSGAAAVFPPGQQERGPGFTSPSAPPPHRTPSRSHCCAAQNTAMARGGAALSNMEARRTSQKGDKLQSAPRREYGNSVGIMEPIGGAGGGRGHNAALRILHPPPKTPTGARRTRRRPSRPANNAATCIRALIWQPCEAQRGGGGGGGGACGPAGVAGLLEPKHMVLLHVSHGLQMSTFLRGGLGR